MAPGKSIGYSRFYNRYKMVVIIEMYGRIFYFKQHKDEQFFAKNSKFYWASRPFLPPNLDAAFVVRLLGSGLCRPSGLLPSWYAFRGLAFLGGSFDPPCSFYNWLKEEEKKKKKL